MLQQSHRAGILTCRRTASPNKCGTLSSVVKSYYEGWNCNSGNYLFTTDTK